MTQKPDCVVNVTGDGFAYKADATSLWSAETVRVANEYDRSVGCHGAIIPYRIRVYLKPSAQEKRE